MKILLICLITASLQHSFTPHLFGNMVPSGYHLSSNGHLGIPPKYSICTCVTSPMRKTLMSQPTIERPPPMGGFIQRRNSLASTISLMFQDLALSPGYSRFVKNLQNRATKTDGRSICTGEARPTKVDPELLGTHLCRGNC